MNTNEIAEKWSKHPIHHQHLRDAFKAAIEEATAQLQKELERRDKKLKELMEEWSKSDEELQALITTTASKCDWRGINFMKTKIKAPKGWRVMRKGTLLKTGDKFFHGGYWYCTKIAGFKVGWDESLEERSGGAAYIRRIKKGKKK